MNPATIIWFRNDLRLKDNPALAKAARESSTIIPLYIHSPEQEGELSIGAASRWWLHQSLASLTAELSKMGLSLIIKRNKTAGAALLEVLEESGAKNVYWNRRYEPHLIEIDKNIKSELKEHGINVQSFYGNLLFEPWEVTTSTGTPDKVFTPTGEPVLHCQSPGPPAILKIRPNLLKKSSTLYP